jgi:hypothetical protein
MEPFRDLHAMRTGYHRKAGLCLFLAFFLLSGNLYGDNIRGRLRHFIEIPDTYEEVSDDIGLKALTAVDFASAEFLRGFILEVVSPASILQFRQSFLLTLYGNISPDPASDSEVFTGRKLLSIPFPTAKKTFIDLPLESAEGWKAAGPGSTRPENPPGEKDFPLLLVIDPVMKGIPSSVASAEFEIVITPVLKDLGALELNLETAADSGEVYFLIDGKDIGGPETRHYLKPGVHSLEVKSDTYLPFRQSFGVEQARVTVLDIELQPARSFVQFQAPEGAAVFFDGEELNTASIEKIETEPGEHVVLVRIGDYSVSKRISVQGGKTYKVSLFFDILIDDN